MIDILVVEDLASPSIDRLAQNFNVVAGGIDQLASARAVMIRNQTKLTREILSSAPNLLAIGRVGVGLDNIDLAAANDLGIVVIAPLEANAISVAELTLGLIISLARKIPQADRSTKSGAWDRRGCTGLELHGKTLALIGCGRIGKLVAARARAFEMRVIVYDPFVKQIAEPQIMLVSTLRDALAAADFVSIHTPLTPQTRNLIDAQALAALKATAYILNTSRGGIINEAALLAALQRNKIAGAALDVREIEPPTGENPFAQMDNVILTPHIGAFTHEAQTRAFEAVCSDLDRILRGQPALNFVNFAWPRRRSEAS